VQTDPIYVEFTLPEAEAAQVRARLAEGGAPVVRSAGRPYPVEIRLLDQAEDVRLETRIATAVRRLATEVDGDLLVFERSDAETGNHVVVAVNRGGQQASAAVDAPAAWGGAAIEAITGAAAPIDAGKLAVTVPPRQARVFVSTAEKPGTGT